VRAPELVSVARAGGDEVGTAVMGSIKPAHLGRRDDDAGCQVVGDQAQEPGQFLACRRAADAHRCVQVSSAGMLSSVRTLVQ
jgi:hypothetical protein